MITAKRIWNVPVAVGLGVALASFALYLSTLPLTLSWGWHDNGTDGGELLAAAKTFGVPHPPGYPTYVLLLRSFATLFPFGDFAFRGNLLSALLASGAIFTIYLTTLRICRSLSPEVPIELAVAGAAMGALALAVSPLMWSLAIITEVYALNALFAALLLLIAADLAFPHWEEQPSAREIRRRLIAFGLLLGIGLGNHLTLLAVAAPLAIWLSFALGWRRLASPWLAVPFVLGLAVYVYLPVRAAQDPPINWGDADTLGGFVWMLSAKPYQHYLLNLEAGAFLDRALKWVEVAFNQFNPLGLFFGLMGIVALRTSHRGLLAAAGASIAIISAFTLAYNTVDFEVPMLMAFVPFALFVGVGFFRIISGWTRIPNGSDQAESNGQARPEMSLQVWVLGVLGFLLLPGLTVVLNHGSQDLSGDRTAYDHGMSLIEAVPEGSVVLALVEKDLFPLWYMRYVEQPDKDVAVVAAALLQFDWYVRDTHRLFPNRVPAAVGEDFPGAVVRFLEHNQGKARVFLTFRNRALVGRVDLQPVGPVFEASLR